MNATQPETDREEYFPIRTVAAVTGVNPVTLRAWERRYGLIEPARTPKGHRLYSQGDIDRINQTIKLLDRGIAISQVRDTLSLQSGQTAGNANEPRRPDVWTGYRAQAIIAIIRFDEDRLDQLYNDALALYPIDIVTEHMLLPLLVSLGERWASTEGSIAEEHFFGAFMRNKLGARFHHRHKFTAGRKLLVTCMQGEQHEIGAMLFSLAAHDRGFRIVFLGADMPLNELAQAARRAHCDGIVISASIDPPPFVLEQQLPALVQQAQLPVFVGGQTSIRCVEHILKSGAHPIGTDIRGSIHRIDETLNGQ